MNTRLNGIHRNILYGKLLKTLLIRKPWIHGKDAGKVLIITSDHTRPVPSKITMPLLLDEIRSMNPDVEIKILIATGFHRLTTTEEMINKFGRELVEKEEIINHDSRDMKNMVFKGILPSGGELWLNSLVDWADWLCRKGLLSLTFCRIFGGERVFYRELHQKKPSWQTIVQHLLQVVMQGPGIFIKILYIQICFLHLTRQT